MVRHAGMVLAVLEEHDDLASRHVRLAVAQRQLTLDQTFPVILLAPVRQRLAQQKNLGQTNPSRRAISSTYQ